MAQFIDFPEANKSLGSPPDMAAESCGTLRVHTDGTTCISRWQPTPEELAELNDGGSIWLGVRSGSSQPAVWLSAHRPAFGLPDTTLTDEIDEALQQFARRLPDAAFAGGRPQTGAELHDTHPTKLYEYLGGGEMKAEQLYFVSSPEIIAQHLENMRDAFRTSGRPAVVAYLKPYAAFLQEPES